MLKVSSLQKRNSYWSFTINIFFCYSILCTYNKLHINLNNIFNYKNLKFVLLIKLNYEKFPLMKNNITKNDLSVVSIF